MGAGVLAAIGIVSALLPLIQQAIELINKAHAEGRDITPAELATIQQATDTLYDQVMAGLVAAGMQPPAPQAAP